MFHIFKNDRYGETVDAELNLGMSKGLGALSAPAGYGAAPGAKHM